MALAGAAMLLPSAQRWLPWPALTGLCLACVGVSIGVGSASGLWLVSPLVALGCFAFVAGSPENGGVRLLPVEGLSTPDGSDRLAFFLFMVLPWLALYEAVLAIGIPRDAISGTLPFEQSLPVMEWTQVFYGSVYLFVLAVPFFAKTRTDLRQFCVRGLWTMLIAYPAFLAIPLIAPKRAFLAHSVPGHLLLLERSMDRPVAAFPSFHVTWALLAAEVYAMRWPRLRVVFYAWALLVAASCVTTSQHSLLDVVGGIATVALVVYWPRSWAVPMRAIWCGLSVVAVVRLWTLAMPASFIAGVSLVLAGLAMFPGRARRPGWIAIGVVILGAVLSVI